MTMLPADAQHREVLLPGLGPVLLVDEARLELADVAQLERLQMAEVAPRRLDGARVDGGRIIGRDVAADDGRPRGVEARGKALVDELEGASTDDSARAHARQDLADLLDGLLVGADRQLEPRSGRGQSLVRGADPASLS